MIHVGMGDEEKILGNRTLGLLPMSKANLRLGMIMQVSWPPIDKPSIGYLLIFNPLVLFEKDVEHLGDEENDWNPNGKSVKSQQAGKEAGKA